MILNFLTNIFDLMTNADKILTLILQQYGVLIYPFIFLFIFIETGLVVTPLIPGDSLLFISGTLAAKNLIDGYLVFVLAALAAVIGDSVNYGIGNFLGKKAYNWKWIKKEYLERTQEFYNKHGKKTIILARFVPIIRTIAPFVAGVGKMKYREFFSFNVIGGILWTAIFISAGFFFGNIPFIQEHLSIVVFLIIAVSLIPVLIEYLKHRKKKNQ